MYYNEKHKRRVEQRSDGYNYIGTYKCNEITIDGKNKKHNANYIRVKCPYCGKEYDVQNCDFFIRKRVCGFCCNKYENSFAYYIQVELGEGLNKYWDWKENSKNPYYIYAGSSTDKVKLKCDKTNYHDGYMLFPNNFKRGDRCPQCTNHHGNVHPKDSFGQWLIDTYGNDAIEKYWSKKNIINPFEISKGSDDKRIYVLCQEKDYHNDNEGYITTPNQFTRGNRCPYCSGHKVHPKDSFGALYPEKAKYWSKNNKKSPYELTFRSHDICKFICQECGEEFDRSLFVLNQSNTGVFCRKCNCSKLEEKTKNILNKYNISYEKEFVFDDLLGLGGRNLSYDFYLPDYNLLIECQGEQHEKFIKGLQDEYKNFERQLEHDRRKKQYTKNHNIKLLEIWYYDVDNIEEILIKELNLIIRENK